MKNLRVGSLRTNVIHGAVSWLGNDLPLTMLTNLSTMALGIVSGILLARALQPVGRGEFVIATLWPSLAISLGGLGLPQALTYFSGRMRDDLGVLVGTAVGLGLALGIGLSCGGIFLLLPLLKNQRAEVIDAAMINFAFVPIFMIPTLFILQGRGLMKEWNALRLLQSALYVLGLLCLAVSGNTSILNTVVLLCLTSALPGLAALVLVVRLRTSRLRFDWNLAKEFLRYGFKTYLGGLAWTANVRLDQTIMTLFMAPAQIGLYAVAVAMAQALGPVSAAFSNVVFPRVVGTEKQSDAMEIVRRAIRANVLVTCFLSIPLLILTRPLLAVAFGPAFSEADGAARILLVASFFFGTNYILSDALRALNLPQWPSVAEGVGLVITIIGLYVLLPIFGMIGAAITSLVSYTAVTMFLMSILWRVYALSPGSILTFSNHEFGPVQRLMKSIKTQIGLLRDNYT